MQAQHTTDAAGASTIPPLEAMADADVLEHLRQMHGYRMPCCVTAEDHERDHKRTDRNVSMDIEPHSHETGQEGASDGS